MTSSQTLTLQERSEALWQEHKSYIILIGLLLVGYLGVWTFKPLWLLKLPAQDISLPWIKLKVPLSWFKYRNRVLDAWIKQHYSAAQTAFFQLDNVKARAIHIHLPIQLEQTKIPNLQGSDLKPTFQRKTAVLLICGEGGTGKTSLACQIARWGLAGKLATHRMIPVLVETELDEQVTLLAAIQGQLNALTDQAEPIATELLVKLLRRQRVLVIVDHLSEMGVTTRNQIKPNLADFPAKALIVTSRLEEKFKGILQTVLKPLRIDSDRLLPFMSAYLEAKGKQNLFKDFHYSKGCDRLSEMVKGRNITVLLVRLYLEHMIEARERTGTILPHSVPKLMLSYLNQLNRSIEADDKRDNLEVQQDAKAIAWACLKQTYRPTTIKKVDAIVVLAELDDSTSPKNRLNYLEKRLQVLQAPEPGDHIRIVLDPLAEYLAAMYLVEHACQQPNPVATWNDFFASIDQILLKANETPEVIYGFLLALHDCCLDNAHYGAIDQNLLDRLLETAQLDPNELLRQQENRRIQKLIAELSAPEEEFRTEAAVKLGRRGTLAKVAEPELIGMLENPNQSLTPRQAAAQTLGRLGIGQGALLRLLMQESTEIALRRIAVEALGQMQAAQSILLATLEDTEQPLALRQGAARALGLAGAPSGEAVPMLILQIRKGDVITKVKAFQVWKERLPDNLTLDLVALPGGEFMMGSPPDEIGRAIYFPTYEDTKGLDVEAQHHVTVPPFWMGQHPITQAQWRAVASLPVITHELNCNPTNFKGDERPVERVTWHEAVEFCTRLSLYTGNTYRLPSEAEWEYACRAKTTSPFYCGNTLSTDVANYNGNYIYGQGQKGSYRETTVAVGSFGVNAFGLADMHGNVYEWCLDHWHPSYDNAPANGDAWVTDGNKNLRIVRGGSWCDGPDHCRSALRLRNGSDTRDNNVGFRVVCVSP
ncbi:MAG: SUMF1/EgtB/PvdO family nonheme iron enzyme [Cyanobacteria bacterium P01_D01_bin.156]